jgi:predicted acetyltransferase
MFEVRVCRDRDEFVRAFYAIGQYFAGPPSDEQVERWLATLGVERMHAAFADGEITGGAGAFEFELSVPGGAIPCAGVTVVGVYPTHRRRGVLRAMMRKQLDDVHERGEPIAALWASEETIYGRFGYGVASWVGEVNVPREWGGFARPLERRGQARFVTGEEAVELFPAVWEALRAERPGVPTRPRAWWEWRVTSTPAWEQSFPRRFVALDVDGTTQAYAVYRAEVGFDAGISTSRLEVVEAIGATPQATAEIWRFLFDIDWTERIVAGRLPPDHPLFLLAASPRRLRYRMGDSLWVRLVDVGAALSGRAYSSSGRIVFEVRDAFCPWNEGRWLLEDGTCARTDDAPDLALDVDALGSAYLGGVSFAQLRDAFRVKELTGGAVERADSTFAWRPLPWCPEIF